MSGKFSECDTICIPPAPTAPRHGIRAAQHKLLAAMNHDHIIFRAVVVPPDTHHAVRRPHVSLASHPEKSEINAGDAMRFAGRLSAYFRHNARAVGACLLRIRLAFVRRRPLRDEDVNSLVRCRGGSNKLVKLGFFPSTPRGDDQ